MAFQNPPLEIRFPPEAADDEPHVIHGMVTAPPELIAHNVDIVSRRIWPTNNPDIWWFEGINTIGTVTTGWYKEGAVTIIADDSLLLDGAMRSTGTGMEYLFTDATRFEGDFASPIIENPNGVNKVLCSSVANVNGFCTSNPQTTTSNTFANCTGSNVSTEIYKQWDETLSTFEVTVAAWSWMNGGVGSVEFAVQVNSVDYRVCSVDFGLASLRLPAVGTILVPAGALPESDSGLPYVIQLRWRRKGGAGTCTRDILDMQSITVREVSL